MTKKVKISELTNMLQDLDIEALEGVEIEGDIEIDIGGLGGFDPNLAHALGHETAQLSVHLANISRLLGYPVEQAFASASMSMAGQQPQMQPQDKQQIPFGSGRLSELLSAKLEVEPAQEWTHTIQEVTLGATSSDGGSRKSTVTIGGEKALPYYFDAPMPNRNYVTMDVFDMPIGMAKAVKVNYEDVMGDPGEWAKKVVNEFNADMVTVHLVSTDPMIKDTSPREASKVVEDVLQAVDVPLVIGGSGNPQKDPEVLEKAAEVAEGERVLLASASLNLDYERIAKAAINYGHAVLSWTQLEINAQKELNRKLMKQCNVPRESIVMDPTTAALGYGLDYAYTNMERIRLAGLMGDEELTFPMSSGTTNAWGARESWMKSSPMKDDSDWGPREYRGPIWEIVTGLSLALAGNDLFMMMHPTSVQVLKEITQTLYGSVDKETVDISNWVEIEMEVQ
ncbi:CO dehydrogenase/acetyl-CoA synthase subunit delta [Methanosalsum natronophilum]|uniref:Acetyl-CoA decarbonylase/synthase complex subunit delta n=1 Tax=Methanosalsum natronophilum TaxID=768733 RepID=A0A424YPR0_9EURY|nr:CO dehydrogenase/acetyl-CoA synthase subunit delta [Methanosalsum natronophilum]MCS3924472.1 acetyl-CoA decarbonylase/synthase complex subunit delta [Methanosalsum natronophilum]RQD80986.1 MAG: CO dehydrogenase/acetyl-CoA synthase subunit delta [Methanosalsum natronophilum]